MWPKPSARSGLNHVVITSVDRDDLDDGGAAHFAAVIRAIRESSPGTTIEVLTPDFLRKDGALEQVIEARPDVFNHNLETVPSLYLTIRPGSRYFHSLRLLQRAKELDPQMFTKSGLMVGLGEERNELLQVMDDMRSADVDFLTIGQYLQPTRKHAAVDRFVPPEEFAALERTAYAKGFLMVSASPLTRSSYHAGDDFAKLRAARQAGNAGARRHERFRTTKRVAHSADDMFALVADVERYPQFVPLCERLVLKEREPHRLGRGAGRGDDGGLSLLARILRDACPAVPRTAAYPRRVCRWPVQVSGEPLDFQAVGENAARSVLICPTSFALGRLQMLMGKMFDRAFRKFVTAFEQRADRGLRQGRPARADAERLRIRKTGFRINHATRNQANWLQLVHQKSQSPHGS